MAISSDPHGRGPGADASPDTNLSLETERTVPEGRLCASCGTTLAGRRRQAHFCSDRCRMTGRRAAEASRRGALLNRLKQAVAEIELELMAAGQRHEVNHEPRA